MWEQSLEATVISAIAERQSGEAQIIDVKVAVIIGKFPVLEYESTSSGRWSWPGSQYWKICSKLSLTKEYGHEGSGSTSNGGPTREMLGPAKWATAESFSFNAL
jgi:hypothetical protein